MIRDTSIDVRQRELEVKRQERLKIGEQRLRIARSLDADSTSSFAPYLDSILLDCARQIAGREGIRYESLSMVERFLLTRFRCPACGSLPFYFLDIKHLNKTRCGKCSLIVGLKSSGKYGKIRKEIAITACRSIDEALDSSFMAT